MGEISYTKDWGGGGFLKTMKYSVDITKDVAVPVGDMSGKNSV